MQKEEQKKSKYSVSSSSDPGDCFSDVGFFCVQQRAELINQEAVVMEKARELS
jgi:hypothetical protein